MKKELKRLILRRGRVGKIQDKRHVPSVRGATRRYGQDLEDWPEREGNRVSRRRRQGDDLGPLVRYLETNVGRPWNSVFSEMSQNMRGTGVDAWHLRLHVRGLVDDAGRWKQSRFGRASEPYGLYVDEHGILRNKPYRYRFTYKGEAPSGDRKFPFKTVDGKIYVNDGGWKQVTPTYVKWSGGTDYTPFYVERPNPDRLRFSMDHPYRTSACGRFILRPKLKTLSRQEISTIDL